MPCQVTGTEENYFSIASDKSDADDSQAKKKKKRTKFKLMRVSGIPATAAMPIHTLRRKPCEEFASHWPLVTPACGLKRFISNKVSLPLDGQH
jgi:hypothetical protein